MKDTKIKICGLRTPEDIQIINRFRPDFAGFICCSRFWRFIPKEDLRVLSDQTDPGIRKVRVFVDDPVEVVSSYIKEGLIDLVQLHGREDESYMERLRKETGGAPIIKAFRIRCQEDIREAAASSADYILLDGGQGEGRTFDWSLLDEAGRDYFLAGGLNPENIGEALRRYHPYAVDISSGVETEKHKDADKVRECIRITRGGRT